MPISRYPRFGSSIAPKLLAPVLQAPLPDWLGPHIQKRYGLLAALDASAWTFLTAKECELCADAVVSTIARHRYDAQLKQLRFPALPDSVTLDELELEVRTFNCLDKARQSGHIRTPAGLRDFTASDILTIRGFGIRCLVDLVSSIEGWEGAQGGNGLGQQVPLAGPGLAKSLVNAQSRRSQIDLPLTKAEIRELLKAPERVSSRNIHRRRLPTVPSVLSPADLHISARTRHCLDRLFLEKCITSLSDLSRMTVGDLLECDRLGRKSLLNLLGALATFLPELPGTVLDGQPRSLSSELTRCAERLRDLRFARLIRCDDLRFGRYLKPLWVFANSAKSDPHLPLSSDLHTVAHRIVGRERDTDPDEAVAAIKKARMSISAGLRLPLEKELLQLVACSVKSRRVSIFLQYYGWDGGGGATLQAVGDRHRLTRERVRQIVSPSADLLRRARPFTPVLDHVLAVLDKRLPLREVDAIRLLLRRKLLSGPFQLDGVMTAAELLGRPLSFDVEGRAEARVVVRSGQRGVAELVSKVARRAISRFGISSVADICSGVNDLAGGVVDTKLVSDLLREQNGFRELDENGRWFWRDDISKNHLVRYLQKIFAVCPRIHASELRGAISADPRGLGYAPPTEVVLEFCRQALGCEAESQVVVCRVPPRPESVLTSTEMVLLKIFAECGPLLSRSDWERECRNRGINRHTAGLYLGRVPLIARYAPGIYGLRGVDIAPGEIERFASQRARTRHVQDYGWSSDARLWIIFELSRSVLSSGVFYIPTGLRNLVEGRFVLFAEGRSRLGALVIAQHGCWGLSPLFTRRGGQPGDTLLLIFDLRSREAEARMGTDRELLEETLSDPALLHLSRPPEIVEARTLEGTSIEDVGLF